MCRILAGVVLAVMLTGGAAAGPLEDGTRAYERGDYATALRVWRPLAEQGAAPAQFGLGVMYVNGNGVPLNYAEAAKWFSLAAEQGADPAQYSLGVMYAFGQGVPVDYVEAAKWFSLAAEQGLARAQYNLGALYFTGEGVPQDYVQAHMWFNLAAARGDDRAIKFRDDVASKMTLAQIAEAQKLAREWKPK